MKKFLSLKVSKITAIILSSVLTVVFSLCLAGVVVLWENRAFTLGEYQNTHYFENVAVDRGENLLWNYIHHKYDYPDDLSQLKSYEERSLRENSNFFYTVTDADGNVIMSNAVDESARRTFNDTYEIYDNNSYTTVRVSVVSGIYNELSAKDDIRFIINFGKWLYSARYWLFAIGIFCVICELLILCYLCSFAGRRPGANDIRIGLLDKIPLEIYVLATFLGLLFAKEVFSAWIYYDDVMIAAIIAVILFGMPLICFIAHTLAVRIKTHTLIKNTLLYQCVRFIKSFCGLLWRAVKKIPLIWKTVAVWLGLAFVELVLIIASEGEMLPVIWTLDKMLLTVALLWILLCMLRLQRAAKEISEGNIEYKVSTKYMPYSFKEHGENLNGIADGLNKAVAQSIKSERMKAELITNVSHDIKTPLTSIVNYVDLLYKEGINGENAIEYLEVLKRQSARLKKLTEDLIEASKASTGNIKVEIKNVDIEVLLLQAIGEYNEKLDAKQLTVVTSFCNDKEIFADGKLMWWILDNLFSNICKYSKSDTRVYISVRNTENIITLTLKNISADPLDISGDELTERFVRGDASRNTEGSGLGLSIARSLVEIQGGRLAIDIDGDLFKTIITFKKTP
ncbi:MAG: HAMP domain-containing histidine kinase [Clostridia bacterium]|nr:HAMP domain-containing histidine kinase [Clostridia bacterium]